MTERTEITDLSQQIARINEMQEAVPYLVKSARIAGASWTQIGKALGTSKQAAHQRYSLYLPDDFAGPDDESDL